MYTIKNEDVMRDPFQVRCFRAVLWTPPATRLRPRRGKPDEQARRGRPRPHQVKRNERQERPILKATSLVLPPTTPPPPIGM